jgi:P27 family predicted phage terminase small subunit
MSDTALCEYHRLVAVLAKVGTLDRTDPTLVVAAAQVRALLAKAHAELDASELVLEASNGTPMPHPMLAVVNTMTNRLRGLMKDLGLTAATAKLGDRAAQATAEAENPWGDLLGFFNLEGR